MAVHSHQWVWTFEQSPESLWPYLSDTARFNEAAGLPKHDIIETPQPDGSVLYEGRGKQGRMTLEWREEPVNWVANQWFEHRRHFTKGPLKMLCAQMRLEPDGTGCRCIYTLSAEAAGLLGEIVLRTVFFKSVDKTFGRMVENVARFVAGERDVPFDVEPPKLDAGTRQRVDNAVAAIEESPHGHGLARKLADLATTGQEVDVVKLRPLELARRWNAPARHVIELCLEATRVGLLNLRWDILCPRCRVAKSISSGLDELPTGAHCGTCNIDYDREFSRNVELSFQPAPGIRPIAFGEYCLFGPMSTPHVVAQIAVPAGEARELDAGFPPGPYRLRTLEAGPETDIDYEGGGFPAVTVSADAVTAGEPAAPGKLALSNTSPHDRIVIVEELVWERDALTADRVTALQAFRDLFSDQVLRPGDEVSIQRVALMFTDLRGSTALYGTIGDARAYGLVRDHFAVLTQIVRNHDGAVVKTIGDAVMAAFTDPGNALAAAIEIQQAVAAFNAEHAQSAGTDDAVTIKIGLHEGPCIAVTLNDRLDYFGTTVNMAARLQGQSAGGDIVLSEEIAEDPAVAATLGDIPVSQESAELRGFDAPVPFRRLESFPAAAQ
ncbi:MAG: adenylate/guanylate cyclase domain-containing protein [Alphaproteobacteria bacterium]|nr:adenylate/guanylate cyclase domain-containing protein [Alphaproteobacteria bacterium]